MNKLIILCLLLSGATRLFAQTEKSPFLFDDFKTAIIYYKDGRQFSVPLNYNLVTNQFLFIDKNDDNLEKEFTDPEMIVSIEIGKRFFLSPTEGATEIIQSVPQFYVQYQGVSKQKGTAVGYGGKTETASTSNYTNLRSGSIIGGAQATDRTLSGIDKSYKIKVGKKEKQFSYKKQFLKLYSTQKEVLNKYIEDNKISFDSIEQVLQLYNYAITLPDPSVKE